MVYIELTRVSGNPREKKNNIRDQEPITQFVIIRIALERAILN